MAKFAVKPEVMSPAGYWPQLHAAIDAGADSVYFGLKHFTARAKVGFSLDELSEALKTLHQHGVKGFITFNTLIFENELAEASRAIASIAGAGADALIVQDIGALKLARQIAPEMELHGSTQMSITSAEGVEMARAFGVDRVTLARELSLHDLRAIRAQTDCELEIFVHGALCVAYSGQCFSSEAWGGRSANRGQCAQACRLPYELVVDGILEPLGDARYLLSPGDLYALHQVAEITAIGISALKIEGRYKDADYVSAVTRAYRKAVDEAWAERALSVTPMEELRLSQVYSRGLAPHFLTGTNHQAVVEGRAPRHRGVRMGQVTRVLADAVWVAPAEAHRLAPLKPGDGLVFDAAAWRSPEEPEEGGRVFQSVGRADGSLELRFGNSTVNFQRIRPGDLVWRTHDPDLAKHLKAAQVYRQPVNVRVKAREGQPLEADWWIEKHPEMRVRVTSPAPLKAAQRRPLSADFLREQFGRLGESPYQLEGLEFDTAGAPFAPASLLNQLRREAVEKLAALQLQPRAHAARVMPLSAKKPRAGRAVGAPKVHLLVRTPEQLNAALDLAPASITLDYLDLYGLKPSVERVKASGMLVRVASPRVLKPAEERIVHFLRTLACPILVRSTGLLKTLREQEHPPLIGDFSLNAANSLTSEILLEFGLSRLTPTYDLNAAQIAELARNVGPALLEVVAYQHLPVFHTEHCVFARFLSSGTTYKDCGHPCETHRVELRDLGGLAHPVLADIGCRNTVFGAAAQEASTHLDSWRSAGIEHFRLEFVDETPEELRRITRAFEDTLACRTTAAQLSSELKRTARQGTTEGSLFIPNGYQLLPILQ